MLKNQNKEITCLQWNIRNFKSQKPHLLYAIDEIKPDILILQETHLSDNDHAQIPGYKKLHRKDRDRKGGGVAIAVKNDIPSTDTPTDKNNELEIVATTIVTNTCTNIINGYIPPYTTETDLQMYLDEFKN